MPRAGQHRNSRRRPVIIAFAVNPVVLAVGAGIIAGLLLAVLIVAGHLFTITAAGPSPVGLS